MSEVDFPAEITRRELPHVVHVSTRRILDGMGVAVRLVSGFEISIVRHSFSYGGPSGLFEIAMVTPDGHVEDPVGWLDADEVFEQALRYAEEYGPTR